MFSAFRRGHLQIIQRQERRRSDALFTKILDAFQRSCTSVNDNGVHVFARGNRDGLTVLALGGAT